MSSIFLGHFTCDDNGVNFRKHVHKVPATYGAEFIPDMPDVARTIREWLGGAAGQRDPLQQEAARTQLQGHIEPELLEAFLQRDVDEEQHQTVIDHLNQCELCREAIAVVLLAVDNPKAAAELELERKRRHEEEPEVWWIEALRWSALVIVALALIVVAVVIPKSKDPDSAVGRWFEKADESVGRVLDLGSSEASPPPSPSSSESSSTSSSSTSFGRIFSSTYVTPKAESRSRIRGGVVHQLGWDTGPAPYAGKVAPSYPYREVEMFPERADSESQRAAESSNVGQTTPAHTETSTSSGGPAAGQHARRRLVVGPAGELKRTFDGGQTWQQVVVAPNLVFRSLALSGHTVWAAGDAGALYRSADAAEHWQQVQISYRGAPIQDDLVAISFSDPQHGNLRASSGREWTTVDGGNKWVLNPMTASAK